MPIIHIQETLGKQQSAINYVKEDKQSKLTPLPSVAGKGSLPFGTVLSTE